jgi:hypothetical protein
METDYYVKKANDYFDRLLDAQTQAFQHKFYLAETLVKLVVLDRQGMPVSRDGRNTDYWPYPVLKPEELPPTLKAEYDLWGEVRV